jgi:hypothetical protein
MFTLCEPEPQIGRSNDVKWPQVADPSAVVAQYPDNSKKCYGRARPRGMPPGGSPKFREWLNWWRQPRFRSG